MRVLVAIRVALGVLGLLRPRTAVRWYGGDPQNHGTVVTARVLGGRHLVQAAVLTARPDRTTWLLGSAVDLLHGASMVGLATVSPRFRRPAATSASVAFGLAAVTLGLPRAGRPRT